jgi:beta-glucanase (GH16 family)
MNSYMGSSYQETISGVTNLNNTWYDGQQFQSYAFEYTVGDEGKITWFVGEGKTWALDARALGPNGNVGQRVIPEEPLSVIINFGLSKGFAYVDTGGLELLMPATMRVDYVRIYQEQGMESVTCDPPGYETTQYIAEHSAAYQNANLTLW